jgi:transcriptional regulator with XRE-family HTH domain
MDHIIDDTGTRIAHTLRLERQARGWSMSDLAERSGVSKASISKIEREELSPSATILVRLAGAFDMTLAGLLLKTEGGGERLSRAADQPVWRDPDTDYSRKQVFCRPDHPVELVEVELPAWQSVNLPASSYAHIRQLVWVRLGELVITEAGERHHLFEGDCLGFGPPSEVTFSNEGALACTYIVALARS